MKILLLTLPALVLSINLFAQPYPEVTIMEIQYQDSILILGDLPSPYTGDTLTIVGVVMVAPYRDANPDSGTTLIAGAPALILQDTVETDWAGMLVRYPGMPVGNPFGVLDTGYVIRATGVVVEFFKTTEFDLISFEGSDVLGFMQRPQPVPITLDSLAELGGREGKLLAERWESVFVRADTVTATSGGIGQGSYEVFDENNTQVITGNQSSYFRNATPPVPGTVLEYITGYIQNRDNVPGIIFANLIVPAYPGDVEVLLYAPSISNLTRNPILVGFGDPVTVSAQISDEDGTISSAKLFYRKNMGASNQINMTNTSGNNWQAVIPAQNDSSLIDFYLWAQDNDNNVSYYPVDTTRNRFFYLVLNRALTIQDVQYSPFGSGFSGYNSYEVTVRGIVTADTTDIQGDGTNTSPAVFIQNGSGAWSGIKITGTETLLRSRGDDVTVTGTVAENFSVTEIGGINSPSGIVVNSTGNPLPNPEPLVTSTISELANGTVQAEQWEGVLINYTDITVNRENADGLPGPDEGTGGNRNFGEMYVIDASNDSTRVEMQDGTHSYHNFWAVGMDTISSLIRVRSGDTFDELRGILFFSFGDYKLVPRKDDDFIGHTMDADVELALPENYSLSQNFPNPFNPSTKIEYTLPVEENVSLKIFNILGQQVLTLMNNEHTGAGRHTVAFDAGNLSSGIYIYRLQAGNFSSNKKMILLK